MKEQMIPEFDGVWRELTEMGQETWVAELKEKVREQYNGCLLYTSPSPRDQRGSRMPSSA